MPTLGRYPKVVAYERETPQMPNPQKPTRRPARWRPPAEMKLALARAAVTRQLGPIELPEVFAQATVASAACAYERETKSAKASRRRLNDKVTRLLARDE